MLDNVTELSASQDILHYLPRSTKVVATTRNAQLLSRSMPHVRLGPYDEVEASTYLRDLFRAAQRPFDEQSVASLVAEVGLVPRQL